MDPIDRQALDIVRRLMEHDDVHHAGLMAEQCGDDAVLSQRVQRLLQRLDELKAQAGPDESGGGDATGIPDRDPDRGAAEACDHLIGTCLGPFRIVERIGRGGMGVIYRGRRESDDFNQDVALKLVRRGFDFDEVYARFLRERRILARLDHPNRARFIDGGMSADARPWFALELVHGQRISAWCDQRRLGIRQRVELFLHVYDAVQYAHLQLVVHRDLKPDNILVDEHGHVRLLDFGIARLLGDDEQSMTVTRSGFDLAMTPEYAAPEQFSSNAVGVSADI